MLAENGLWQSFERCTDDSDSPLFNEELLLAKALVMRDPQNERLRIKNDLLKSPSNGYPGQ